MNIKTENDRAYIVECGCGHVFDHTGEDEMMACPACGTVEGTMTVVGRWWASAGWAVHELPIMAPTVINPARPRKTIRGACAA